MGEVSTIGLDIAKSIFQVHGVDVDGAVVIRRRISRAKILEFFGGAADLPRWYGSVCNSWPNFLSSRAHPCATRCRRCFLQANS